MLWKSLFVGFCCCHLISVLCDDEFRCDPDKFYKPYVKLFTKRRSSIILKELDSSGFLDLSGAVDHYLCVNGPAIEYRDVIYEDELAPKVSRKFSELTPQTSASAEVFTSDGKSNPDDTLQTIIEEVKSVEETMTESGESHGTNESVMKILDQVEHMVDAIENNIGDHDEGSEALVNEILQEIESTKKEIESGSDKVSHGSQSAEVGGDTKDPTPIRYETKDLTPIRYETKDLTPIRYETKDLTPILRDEAKDPTPELLDKIKREISTAKTAIDKLSGSPDDGVENPSITILDTIITEIETAKTTMEICSISDDPAKEGVTCQSSSDILENIMKELSTAQESLKNMQPSSEPSVELLDQIMEEVLATKDAIGNEGSSDSKKHHSPPMETEKNDAAPQVLDTALKDIIQARTMINHFNKDKGRKDPSSEILSTVMSEVSDAKNMILDCKKNKDKSCQISSTVLGRVIQQVTQAKKSVDKLEGVQGTNNPSSDLLVRIIEELKDTKYEIDLEDQHKKSKKPSVEYVMHKMLVYLESGISNLTKTGNNNPFIEALAKVGEVAVDVVESCTKNKPASTDSESCFKSKIPHFKNEVSDAKKLISNFAKNGTPDDGSVSAILSQMQETLTSTINKNDHDREISKESSENDPNSHEPISVRTFRNRRKYKHPAGHYVYGRSTINDHIRQKRASKTRMTTRAIAAFTDAELTVYNHHCFVVNRATRKVFLATRASVSRMKLTRSMDTIGKKTYGITLIGQPDDYRETEIYQFLNRGFEHLVGGVSLNKGNSFVTIGKLNSWCHKSSTQDLKIRPDPTSPGEVCKRGGGNKQYDDLFPVGVKTSDYKWKVCDKLYPTNTTTGPIVYEHFSTMDKHNIKGGKGGPGVKHPAPDVPAFIPGFLLPMSSFFQPNTTDNSTDNSTVVDVYPDPKCSNISSTKVKCTIDADHCVPLPVFSSDTCTDTSTTDPCENVEIVLDLVPSAPKVDDVQWKLPILTLIDSIFNKICKRVNPFMAPSLTRVMMHYLNNIHDKDNSLPRVRRATWDFLESELTRCDKNAHEMVFTWHSGPGDISVESKKKRRKRQLDLKFGKTKDFKKMRFNGEDTPKYFRNPRMDPAPGFEPGPAFGSISGLEDISEQLTEERKKREGLEERTEDPMTMHFAGEDIMDQLLRGARAGSGDPPTTTGSPDATSDPNAKEEFVGINRPVHELFAEPLDPDNYIYPENVSVHLYQRSREPAKRKKRSSYGPAIPLYYFEDAAEVSYDLSIPIDLHFKVFATVAGYCNLFYMSRKSETFPRLYSTYYEDIFSPVDHLWLRPADTAVMKFLFSEYLTEPVMRWIDSCLEGSYLVSQSPTYRPPRPLIIDENSNMVANYFIDEPPHVINQKRDNNDVPPIPTTS